MFQLEKTDFDHCVKNLIVQSFRRIVIKKDSSRLSIWYFTVFTASTSSFKNSIRSKTLEEENFSQKLFIVTIDCIKALLVQKLRRSVIKNDSSGVSKRCFSLTSKLIFFIKVKISNLSQQSIGFKVQLFCFLHQNEDTLNLKSVDFDPCIKILIVQNL